MIKFNIFKFILAINLISSVYSERIRSTSSSCVACGTNISAQMTTCTTSPLGRNVRIEPAFIEQANCRTLVSSCTSLSCPKGMVRTCVPKSYGTSPQNALNQPAQVLCVVPVECVCLCEWATKSRINVC